MLPKMDVAAIAGGIFVVLSVTALLWTRKRERPEDRERQRRLHVNTRGRLLDCEVTDITPEVVYYKYSVSGVDYAAAQDISDLKSRLPEDLDSLVGPATVKFINRNPMNSILICEEWSGFAKRKKRQQ